MNVAMANRDQDQPAGEQPNDRDQDREQADPNQDRNPVIQEPPQLTELE